MRFPSVLPFVMCGVLTSGLGASVAMAQPSDARIIKDLKSPGVLSVKLLGRGSRVWSRANLQYTWDRSAIVVRKAGVPEYPNATLEIGGIATYSIVGGSYPFKRFYVSYNRYRGIPAPSAGEIIKLVQGNLPELLGHRYNSIVGNVQPIALTANPQWNWHTPNSVSLLVTTGYTEKVSNTQLEKKRATIEVRLYRDKIKGPWKSFFGRQAKETSLGRSTHDADALAAMKTLNVLDAERQATRRLAALPAVSVPEFKTDLALFAWLHKELRTGNPQRTEAILRRLVGPRFRQSGSDVLLDSNGERLIEEAIRKAYKGKSTYAEQYGPDPVVMGYQPNMINFRNADGRHGTGMEARPAGGIWQNGVKVGETYKLFDLSIGMATDADEIARLRSMPVAMRFAPPVNAQTLSQLGGHIAEQSKVQAQIETAKAIRWTLYTSARARLKLAFPAAPTETEGQMNGKYPMWTVEAKHPQVVCRVVSIVYGTGLNRGQAQTAVNSAMQGLIQNNNATVNSMTEWMSGTYGQIAVLAVGGTIIKVRVFVVRDVMYQLIMSGSQVTMIGVDEREFFGSFAPL